MGLSVAEQFDGRAEQARHLASTKAISKSVRHEGGIEVAGFRKGVASEDSDPLVGKHIDVAYRSEYCGLGEQYVHSVNG